MTLGMGWPLIRPLANCFGFHELLLVVHVHFEAFEELIRDARFVDELAERLRRDHETPGHGQLCVDHFTQAGALAAHDGDVGVPYVFKPYH